MEQNATHPTISTREFFYTWAKIALLSFGGPAGQIALMHRIIVDEKNWLDEARFLHALNFCMLLPGPEAQQLATYIGWLLKGVRGGLIAGILFILPGVVAIMALSWLYVLFAQVYFVQIFFYGLKAAILAIVIEALLRIGKRALKNRAAYMIAALAFIAMFALHIPFPLVIIGAALLGYTMLPPANNQGGIIPIPTQGQTKRNALYAALVFLLLWLAPLFGSFFLLGRQNVFTEITFFFSKMAVVTFGGAYAVLAYVAQEAVQNFAWLQPNEMLDGLGMAETTPGPLIMVLQFVGFLAAYRHSGWEDALLAGSIGGILTTWVTFVPCFLWIFLGAPYIESLRHKPRLSAALAGVTSAVAGVILNLSFWFGLHVLFNSTKYLSYGPLQILWPDFSEVQWPALIIFGIAALCLFRWHWGVGRTLLFASFSAYALLLLFGGQ